LEPACFILISAIAGPGLPYVAFTQRSNFLSQLGMSRRAPDTRFDMKVNRLWIGHHLIPLDVQVSPALRPRSTRSMTTNEEQARAELSDKFGNAVTDHPDVMAECE
jgi:hypothetical protein